MRIITGLYKGRTILTVGDFSVRPATERVRQTIFNMLANRIPMEDVRVLDLFAGSGSLGLEALSRGASHATFVEQGEEAAACIEQNARAFGCEERTEILTMDAMSYLVHGRGPFDIVFADPPYDFVRTPDIPVLLFDKGLVRPGGYLLIEHAEGHRFESSAEFTAGPQKKFGRTIVTFFRPTMTRSSAP